MSAPVTLLMAIHCHQPVGNFGFVFEEAYEKSYDPFLRVLERHPAVRLALHYSGPLLDWLAANRPEFLGRVRALVERGQAELLASGYAEPILPIIPEADRQGQIARMRRMLRAQFGAEVSGLWLTERVWEPELPETLAKAGIRYTLVDTNQFLPVKALLPPSLVVEDGEFWDALGCYATESAGSSVTLFPASKRLRYWMPFQAADRTIEFLRTLRREAPVAITFADDGEKFGFWPKTYDWVYREGWLDQFFSALEREREWLATTTCSEWLARHGTDGRVRLPAGSYEEMLEWSGGNFRNFFLKYPEAHAMEQKMLRVSRELGELAPRGATDNGAPAAAQGPSEALADQARHELYLGQCNCAYWHGVFGGLYLSHLRRAVYTHLIEAERLIRQARNAPAAIEAVDADADGRDEISVRTGAMGLVVDPDGGGAITEWSLYGPRINLSDTLTRRPEPYHDKLKAQQLQAAGPSGEPPASIHDALGVREEHLEAHLVYDDHRRSGFLDYGLTRFPTLQELARSSWGERRLWSAGPFTWDRGAAQPEDALSVAMSRELPQGRIRKEVRVSRTQASMECVYQLEGVQAPAVALEFNLSLRDERYLTQAAEVDSAREFTVREAHSGLALRLSIEPPARVLCFPIETVSESDQGLERTYQGLSIVCAWPADGATPFHSRLRWSVTSS